MTATPTTTPRFLTITDISALMSVSTKTVRRWIERGELHAHRIGNLLRISQDDFSAFVAVRRS
jgi:excisionase family DNA binding protein